MTRDTWQDAWAKITRYNGGAENAGHENAGCENNGARWHKFIYVLASRHICF